MKRVVKGLIVAVVLVAIIGGAFYGGMRLGQNQVIKNPVQYLMGAQGGNDQLPGQGGQFPRARGTPQVGVAGARGFGAVSADTVQSVEGNTVVVSTQNGTVKVVTSDTTLIQKYVSVTVDKLEQGEQVIVSGTTNADGSITARSIRSLKGLQFSPEEQPTAQP